MIDTTYERITSSQQAFVVSTGAALDPRGWAIDYVDNFFAPLHPDSLQEFIACSEVSEDGHGGRISAPHSSTALAVNTFDWFRSRDLSPIANALDIDIERFVGYERPHGFTLDRPATLDVEFASSTGTAVGVEVKLREPYGDVSNPFSDKYFETAGLWDGIPNLERTAADIRSGGVPVFSTLHAAQLIKHALGLRHSYGEGFLLVYYWHYVPGEIGDLHRKELARFAEMACEDIQFISVTVGELLSRFDPEPDSQLWFDYMTTRYLSRGHRSRGSQRGSRPR